MLVGSAGPLVLAVAAGLVHAAVVTAALELLGRSYLAEGALGVALVGPGVTGGLRYRSPASAPTAAQTIAPLTRTVAPTRRATPSESSASTP